jgi:PAS domain S-box-containing protein
VVPHSLNSAYSDSVSQVLWEDAERVFRRGWRPDDEGNRSAVLIVLPAAGQPSRSSLDRLTHEYELKDELDVAWAARPLELVRDAGRTMLVLDDAGGEPLDRLLGAPMELGRFLHVAVGIAAALGKLHRRGLVHKDVKPANILVNATGEVRLTGFGIASRFARERQSPHPPETIAGTLAYMAPEQTGRMNRSIDSRSDLYALGVTFYQMLTGALPFTAVDPMEWVHCHLARRPLAPAERLREVPGAVSAIVMKLLAKRAEDRYQTAAGLESDLRRCQTEWEAQRRIDDFPLGEQDMPDRLLIPEKLYGRRREVETLLASFDRVVNGGAPELVLVSGYSGIGKSSVVNELQPVLVPPRGLFASGKFDQYKRDIPYSTLAQAFQSLIRPLLGKTEAELAPWRDALREALGPNAGLIVDLVPEVKLIIGEPPPVPELPPQDARRRFQLVFRQFIGVFARPEHPLALFLDDLQWLDAATLDLLEDLLSRSDLRNLLLIGAYRDNEITASHPLMRKLDAIKTAGGTVNEITLGPLAREHIGQLIADTVRCASEPIAPLTQMVHEKTGGNPFFAIQFISSLADERMLVFDHDAACWDCDLDRIHAKGYTDNVVDLMVGKLTRLSLDTQDALRQLACLGNVADVAMLSVVLGVSKRQVHVALSEALRQQLIERHDRSYKFVHDRVQEAAYSLIPEAKRAEAHLRIGRLLAAHTPPEKREEAVFEIVNQLNRGTALIAARNEKEQLADFNLMAGKRAKASTAFVSALRYFMSGAAAMPDDAWEQRPNLIFALELQRAECEFLTGALAAADERLTMLASRVAKIIDQAAIAGLRIDLYTTMNRIDRGVEVCLGYLRCLGIEWSAHPTADEARREYERIWSLLGGRETEALVDLPIMTEPEALATMDVLTKVTIAAMNTDVNLYGLVICRMVNLSLEYGNTDASSVAYVCVGAIAGLIFGNYKAGFRFGRLGYDLVERRGLKRFQARTYLDFVVLIIPWTKHLRTERDLFRRAFDAANSVGDLTYATYACHNLNHRLLAIGDPLPDVQREAEQGLEFAQKARFGPVIDVIATQLALIRNLRGFTVSFGCFNDRHFDELEFEGRLSPPIMACWYWIRKLQARFFAGDYAAAADAWLNAQELLWTSPSFFEAAEARFYGALSDAASCDGASPNDLQQHVQALGAHYRQFAEWAENCPENFESRAAIIGAEMARVENRELDAERLYEKAICSARTNDFVHVEALACELAARYYAARGFEDIARLYLENARHSYLRWGADGKVRQLNELHPQLRQQELARGSARTIEAPVEHLDLATVIKVSQAVSGEMVLEKLIDRLMRAAIEQAGAERGLLIRPQGEALRIDAEATARGEDVAVHVREREARSAVALPESLIRYAIRTRESVILDDASFQNPFSADPYIVQRRARSILSLPLINQGKFIGILYLENNLTPHVFTPERITVLKVLASQAAISLENSRLYHDVADREGRIRRLVDANIIGIFVGDREGRVVEANDAFLGTLGYDREDLVSGRVRWPKLTPPEWREHDLRALEELDSAGTFEPYEKEYFRKDGSRIPVLVGGALFREDSNEGVAFVLDLTERKRAEEALRESERSMRSAIDGIPGLVGVLAPNGDVEAVNRQILEYCGQSLEELRNWGTNGTVHHEDLPHVAEVFMRSIASGIPYQIEQRLRRFDGEYRWFDNRGIPIRDDSGQIVRWYVLLTDIEDRTRAVARLQQMQLDFAHMNRVSTMGELAASLSHEITQPIASARNNARAAQNFLDMQPPDLGEVKEALGCVVGDVDRAGDIIDRIREHMKKAPPRKERFDLNAAINEVIALARSVIIQHGVSIQTRLADGLSSVQGDRVQLQQVILNLVLNAVEAMDSIEVGPRELSISTEQDQTGVLVSVRDSGPGVDSTGLERVFEAFYTTKSSGTGMGLSICRSIIDAHGGRLWAEANEPGGTVFQFTLPSPERRS